MALFLLASSSAGRVAGQAPRESHDPTPRETERTDDASGETRLLDRVLGQMDAAYQGLQSYRAEFLQESEIKSFQRKTEASGKVYFRKPSEMRWSYLKPEKREVYLSGEQIRIYMPSRNQVIEQTWNDAMPGMAPARLFMGVQELVGSFFVSLADTEERDEKAHCLHLTPRKKGTISVEEILLWVGKEDFLPQRTVSSDVLGNRTTLVFRNAEVNVPLEEDLFRFEVPPDAEIVGNPF